MRAPRRQGTSAVALPHVSSGSASLGASENRGAPRKDALPEQRADATFRGAHTRHRRDHDQVVPLEVIDVDIQSAGAGSHSMLLMLWAFAASGHRQTHGTKTVPWLPCYHARGARERRPPSGELPIAAPPVSQSSIENRESPILRQPTFFVHHSLFAFHGS
jgi:hypothetical protein